MIMSQEDPVPDEAAVELLTAMLQTPSLCGREDRLASLLLCAMGEAGFDVRLDSVGNVIGRVGPQNGSPRAVILGHMDTVPGNIPVERRSGVLYGRGAVDAKGPLATGIVAAARAAQRSGLQIEVIGAVQEEGPSMGARQLARGPAPDYLIIAEPSGWDALVMGYKGSQRFSVEISVPCGHTAGPEPTACERAVDFWNRLVEWCGSYADVVGPPDGFTHLTPTLISMTSSSDGLSDFAFLKIGLRLPPGLGPEEAQAGVRALLPAEPALSPARSSGALSPTPRAPDALFCFSAGEPAVRGKKSTPLVACFLRAIRAEEGTPRFKVKTGTSDMNVVGPVWDCPMLAYGPGDSRLDHTPNEHVIIDEYLASVRVLTRVLEEL
jgi:LysW-gamma-L-lysine carboxypeptidase